MKTQLTSIVVASLLLVGCGSDEPLTAEMLREKKVNNLVSQLKNECRTAIRNKAKYPSKVDFHFITQVEQLYMDHELSKIEDHDFPHRLMYGIEADMMNGFGAMIPHTGMCMINFNNDLSLFKIIEVRLI